MKKPLHKRERIYVKLYVAAIPGLAELLQACKTRSERGYANAIDGRRIGIDKGHKFLQLPPTGISSDNRQKMDGHHKSVPTT